MRIFTAKACDTQTQGSAESSPGVVLRFSRASLPDAGRVPSFSSVLCISVSRFLFFAVLAATAAGAVAQAPGDEAPATQPASATAPAEAVDPAALEILKDLEAAGEKHRRIRADVEMRTADRLTGDSEAQIGWLAYRKGDERTPAGFRAHFDTRQLGEGPAFKDEVDYAFDGHFFTVAKHKIKDMQRYQVAAEGEAAQPMRLGKGPFPLPFGQRTDDVIERFEVSTRPVKEGEPQGTKYLRLAPRPAHYEDTTYTRVEMWIDPQTHLPVRLVSRDKNKKVTTVAFKNVRTNVDVDPGLFHMPRPAGWNYRVERLDQSAGD